MVEQSREHWMARALLLADEAEKLGEVPVGAVLCFFDFDKSFI